MSEYLNIGLDITGLLDNSPTHGKGPALIMCRGIKYMPVRRGRWLIGVNGVICSECEQLARFSWNYCPVCGVRMDGKDQGDKEYEDSILAAQKSEE